MTNNEGYKYVRKALAEGISSSNFPHADRPPDGLDLSLDWSPAWTYSVRPVTGKGVKVTLHESLYRMAWDYDRHPGHVERERQVERVLSAVGAAKDLDAVPVLVPIREAAARQIDRYSAEATAALKRLRRKVYGAGHIGIVELGSDSDAYRRLTSDLTKLYKRTRQLGDVRDDEVMRRAGLPEVVMEMMAEKATETREALLQVEKAIHPHVALRAACDLVEAWVLETGEVPSQMDAEAAFGGTRNRYDRCRALIAAFNDTNRQVNSTSELWRLVDDADAEATRKAVGRAFEDANVDHPDNAVDVISSLSALVNAYDANR